MILFASAAQRNCGHVLTAGGEAVSWSLTPFRFTFSSTGNFSRITWIQSSSSDTREGMSNSMRDCILYHSTLVRNLTNSHACGRALEPLHIPQPSVVIQ